MSERRPSAVIVSSGLHVNSADDVKMVEASGGPVGLVPGEHLWIDVARGMAIEILSHADIRPRTSPAVLVSPVMASIVNSEWTFMIGWDGSKEGYEESDGVDAALRQFCAWLDGLTFEAPEDMAEGHLPSTPLDYVWVQFGGDRKDVVVVRHGKDQYPDAKAVTNSSKPDAIATLHFRDGRTAEIEVDDHLSLEYVHSLLNSGAIIETLDGEFVRTVDVWKVTGQAAF